MRVLSRMMMRKRQALVTFCCNLSFCAFFFLKVHRSPTEKNAHEDHKGVYNRVVEKKWVTRFGFAPIPSSPSRPPRSPWSRYSLPSRIFKNKKDTSAYVQPMQPSAARDMGS